MRFLLFFAAALGMQAADWLSASADPKHTRSQPAETELSKETVGDLKLLWKMPFDEPITAPVVLGPIFTHRGIKEMVFVGGADNNLYAVDADLARLVWKRHFGNSGAAKLTAAPVLAPYYGPAPEGDDASTPRRSLFLLTGDGQLHTVRPADAHDLSLPVNFVPPGSKASDLTLTSQEVSTDISGQTWSIRLGTAGKATVKAAASETEAATSNGYTVSVSAGGTLMASKDGHPAWRLSDLGTMLAPVIANNLVFAVSGTRLLVFDLATGVRLYESVSNGPGSATASMALANGHVYFIAAQTIYCYGFPLEI